MSEAFRLNVSNADLLNEIGDLFERQGIYDEAVKVYQLVISQNAEEEVGNTF